MVEALKRSLERLEPPSCANCHIEMIWYRAVRAAPERDEIVHYFQCPNCNRVEEVRGKMRSGNGKGAPPKLARPAIGLRATAARARVIAAVSVQRALGSRSARSFRNF